MSLPYRFLAVVVAAMIAVLLMRLDGKRRGGGALRGGSDLPH